MAIDSRDKRSSSIMVALEFGRVYPNPNGALSSGADRLHLIYCYRGIQVVVALLIGLERSIMRGVHGRLFGRVNRWAREPVISRS